MTEQSPSPQRTPTPQDLQVIIEEILRCRGVDKEVLEKLGAAEIAEEILARYPGFQAQNSGQTVQPGGKQQTASQPEEQRLHVIFDAFQVLVWSAQPDGYIDFVNNPWLAFTGLTREHAVGKGWTVALHPDDMAIALQAWERAIQTKTGLEMNLRLRHVSGEYHWFVVRAQPVLDERGQVLEWYGVNIDINGLKTKEAELAQSREEYRSLAENSPDVIFVLKVPDFQLIYMNHETLLGYTRAELQSSGSIMGRVHPDDQDRVRADWADVVKETAKEPIEYRVQAKDGQWEWLSSYESILARDEKGKPSLIQMVLRPITGRKKAEQAVRESEARFSSIFNYSPVGINIFRLRDGRCVDCNESFLNLIGYSREELIGHSADELNYLVNYEERQGWMKILREKGVLQNTLAVIRRKSGELRYTMGSMILMEMQGEPQVAVLTVDITALKQSEAALLLAQTGLEKQVEERTAELRQSEEKFSKAFYEAPVARALVRETGGVIMDVNEQFLQLFELSRGQVVGQSYHQLKFSRAAARRNEIRHVLQVEKENLDKFELGVRTPSGKALDLLLSSSSVSLGGETHYMLAFVDVTDLKQAQGEIARLAERLQIATHVAHIGIWDWDLRTNVMIWDEENCRVFGTHRVDFNPTYEAWLGRVHPDDRALMDEVRRQVLRGEKDYDIEYRAIWGDGSVHWIKTKGDFMPGEHNQPVRMLGVSYDITESKAARAALLETSLRLKQAVQAARVGLWEYDLRTRKVSFSTEFKRLLGYAEDEFKDEFAAFQGMVHPDDVENTSRVFLEYIKQPYPNYLNSFRMHCKDGSYRWMIAQASIVPNEQGAPAIVMGSLVDINDIKMAEDEIRQSEEKFSRAFNTSLFNMLITRIDTMQITDVNEGFLKCFEYTREEVIGRTARELGLYADSADYDKNMDELAKFGILGDQELLLKTRTGRLIVVLFSFQPFDLNGVPVGVTISIDITGRKKNEQALKEAREFLEESSHQLKQTNLTLQKAVRARDEFMAAMSHELRTPLTGILGISEALGMNAQGNLTEKQLKYIQNIHASGQRLHSLINDVIDFSRLQSGSLEAHLSSWGLSSICKSAMESVKSHVAAKNLLLECIPPETECQVRVDERRLLQILVNLLDNAIKFTQEGGQITISILKKSAEKEAWISITDNGIGIKPENFAQLFQPFVQLDARLSRQFGGTGLGLALCKGLAELMGGRIQVESVFGHGSTFTVILPCEV